MQYIARSRGGVCLSKTYINNQTKLMWGCSKGHKWEATPAPIKKGSWCPHCYELRRKNGILKYTILDLQQHAKDQGGRCLSTKYIGIFKQYKWQCSKGHTWNSAAANVMNDKWCPYCAGTKKGTIEQMKILAKERGGKCLSDNYVNKNYKLTWQCENGHIWGTKPDNIKQGKWCPHCYIHKNEERVRKILEQIYNEPFPTIRPDWLINDRTGESLELDGYNNELELAFEYNGEQHYRRIFYNIKGKNDLVEIRRRDHLKRKQCKDRGVILITIPYHIHFRDFEGFIIKQLLKEKALI